VPPARAYWTTLEWSAACFFLAKSAVVMRMVGGTRDVILEDASLGVIDWITEARDLRVSSMLEDI